MAHPVVNVTAEQAAAAIEGLDPDKVPNVIVFLLRPSAEAGPAGEVQPAIQGALLFWPMADLVRGLSSCVLQVGRLCGSPSSRGTPTAWTLPSATQRIACGALAAWLSCFS